MTEPPVVWIIEGDHWPRATLRAELIERGCDAVGYESLADALAARRAPPLQPPPALIVIDLGGQNAHAEDLVALAQGTPVIGIGGAVDAATDVARCYPWAAYFSRPVSLGEIAAAVLARLARVAE